MVGIGVFRRQRAHSVPIDLEHNMVGGPVDGIRMKTLLIARCRKSLLAIVLLGVPFAKVVGLHGGSITAEKFPVDLVQIIRL